MSRTSAAQGGVWAGLQLRPRQICRIGASPAFCFLLAERRRRTPLAAAAGHESAAAPPRALGSPWVALMDGNSGPSVGGQTAARWPEAIRSVEPAILLKLEGEHFKLAEHAKYCLSEPFACFRAPSGACGGSAASPRPAAGASYGVSRAGLLPLAPCFGRPRDRGDAPDCGARCCRARPRRAPLGGISSIRHHLK
jgi:hypothetical protein